MASVSEAEAPLLRAFHSDAPNAKLSRSASGRRQGHGGGASGASLSEQAQLPTLSVNTLAWATPPSSAGGDGSATLPVGSALRVARAANGVERPPLQTGAAADPMFEPVAIPFRVSLR